MRVLVVGGTGVLGRDIVKLLSPRHEVLTASRTSSQHRVDITSSDQIRSLFEHIGRVDAIVSAAGDNRFAPLKELTEADFAFGHANKLMGQINLVRIGQEFVDDNGSITITSGVTGRRPMAGTASIASNNTALEGFTRAAALEMERGIRLNCVAPEWSVTTLELYGMDPAWGVAAEELAKAFVHSVEGSMTGAVIDAGWSWDPSSGSISHPAAVGQAQG